MILFIDDQLADLRDFQVQEVKKILQQIATKADLTLLTSSSAEEGLNLAIKNVGEIKLMLVDCSFKEQQLQGMDIVQQIRKISKAVLIIGFSNEKEHNEDLEVFGTNGSYLKRFHCDEDVENFGNFIKCILKIG